MYTQMAGSIHLELFLFILFIFTFYIYLFTKKKKVVVFILYINKNALKKTIQKWKLWLKWGLPGNEGGTEIKTEIYHN